MTAAGDGRGRSAVVLGAGLAGMLAATALARHVDRVTVVDAVAARVLTGLARATPVLPGAEVVTT